MTFFLLTVADDEECLAGFCPHNSDCENTFGSYICHCHDGYTKIGVNKCVGKDLHFAIFVNFIKAAFTTDDIITIGFYKGFIYNVFCMDKLLENALFILTCK